MTQQKKKCSRCKKLKPIAEFPSCKTGKLGVHCYCTPCCAEYQKSRNPNRAAIDEQKGLKAQGLKRCKSCSQIQPLSDYYADPRHKDGRQSVCKLCWIVKVKVQHLQKNFGITVEEYIQMMDYQDGVCAICKRASTKHLLSVDHDHDTHRIRGLLCTNCNSRLLPIVEDHKQWVEGALEYLIDPPATFVIGDREIPEDSKFRKTNKGAPILSFQH